MEKIRREDLEYGIISAKVMRDKSLSIESKALYSYLASLSGGLNQLKSSTDVISKEMNMSKNRLFKYLKELKDKGVITIIKTRTKEGQFNQNEYLINHEVAEGYCKTLRRF